MILSFCPERTEQLGLDTGLVVQVRRAKLQWLNCIDKDTKKQYKTIFMDLNKQLINEMNEQLIERINKTIKKNDQLFIIGDFAFGNIKEAEKILKKIHGRKILILGNHDRSAKVMLSIGFDDIFENHTIKVSDGKESIKVFLSHFPYYPTLWRRIWNRIRYKEIYDLRYRHKRIYSTGNRWLLHGHTHSKIFVNPKLKMIHVGVESTGGTPISEKEIVKIIKENS